MYPEAIEQYVSDMVKHMQEVEREASITPEVDYDELKRQIRRMLLSKWIDGDDLILTEEQFTDAYHAATVQLTLNSLMAKGLIDSIESEGNEEVLFLTKKGKQAAKQTLGCII